MAEPFLIPLIAMGIASTVSTYVGVRAWRNRPDAGTIPIAAMMAGATIWMVFTVISGFVDSLVWSVRLYAPVYAGAVVLPPAILLFALEFTGRESLVTNRLLGILAIEPAIVLGALATNHWHGRFWKAAWASSETIAGFDVVRGPIAEFHTVYAYLMILFGIGLTLAHVYRSSELYRRQGLAIVAGILAPLIANGVYLAEITAADLTPVGAAITGALFLWAIRRYRLTEIAPVARDTLVDNINDGILVIDCDGHVVDANPRIETMLEVDPDNVIGEPVESVFDVHQELGDTMAGGFTGETDVQLQTRRGRCHYDVQISPIRDRRDRTVGRLVLIHDVTKRRRHERELERQNEQLEQFASFLSHDLRNPLSVAQGYVQVAREAEDLGYLDEVERSHDRMESMIEEALTYAREGQSIDETDEIDLKTVARRAWGNVQTKNATVSVQADLTIEADKKRLLRALENLYRNAIQHGGDDVSVTVGTVSGTKRGFYVEDDGPGIPHSERETVLEMGFTTDESGSGFGLAIVRTIAQAHGWDLRVTEGSDGGARFEFTGVTMTTATAATA